MRQVGSACCSAMGILPGLQRSHYEIGISMSSSGKGHWVLRNALRPDSSDRSSGSAPTGYSRSCPVYHGVRPSVVTYVWCARTVLRLPSVSASTRRLGVERSASLAISCNEVCLLEYSSFHMLAVGRYLLHIDHPATVSVPTVRTRLVQDLCLQADRSTC